MLEKRHGWGWRVMFTVQAFAAVALVVACARTPTDVEDARYSNEYEGRFNSLFATADASETTEPAEPGDVVVVDACPGCGPPFHAANTTWHVFDSHTGPKTTVHRLATQWHNGNTRWAFHTPASTWRWVGYTQPIVVEPVTPVEPVDAQ